MIQKTINTIDGLLKMQMNVTETMNQIKAFGGLDFYSWGVSSRTNFRDKALVLKVSGHHFKGYVVITLDYSDTYIVNLVTTHGNIKQSFEMVYFDNLFNIIDKAIEYIPAYAH